MTARPPLDYSLAAESPAGHLRQVLQVLSALEANWGDGAPLLHDVCAIRGRIEAALALLEPPR